MTEGDDLKTKPRRWRLDWPTTRGRLAAARLKVEPEDFRVDERLDRAKRLTGAGEHLCVRLQKRGDNTEFVARQLARLAECQLVNVGYCGLKDRHAVTRQWFSLYRPGREADDEALLSRIGEHWPVLDWARTNRKLRRGDHDGNRFVITLRQVSGDRADTEQALRRLAAQGAPNYFGPQRFGHDGANLDRALRIDPARLRAGRAPRRGKAGRASRTGAEGAKNVLYFSAARSWLFNEVLAERVSDGSWNQTLDGEPGSEPTGPLWGDGGTQATGALERLERQIVGRTPELEALFATTRMAPERRALVLRPGELTWQWHGSGDLELSFSLAPGQYATTVLADVFDLEDASLGQRNQ